MCPLPKQKFKLWGSREGNLNVLYVWLKAVVFGLKKYFDKGYRHSFAYCKKENIFWCEDFEELKKMGKFLLVKFLKDKNYFPQIYKSWHQDAEKFLNRTKRLSKVDFSNKPPHQTKFWCGGKSNRVLLKIHNEISDLNEKVVAEAYIADIMRMYLPELIRQKLKKYLPEEDSRFNSYWDVLIALNAPSLAAKEEIELLQIAKKVADNSKLKTIFQESTNNVLSKIKGFQKIDVLIDKHIDKFFWLGGNYTGKNSFDQEYFIKKIQSCVQKSSQEIGQGIKELKESLGKPRKEKEKIAKLLKLDEEFLRIIEILERIIMFFDERKKMIVAPILYLVPFQKEIAKRLNITRDDLVWLTPPEVSQALEAGKVDLVEIKKRLQKCAFYCDVKKEIIVTGSEVDHFVDYLVIKEETKETKEIKGTIANFGKVRGIVKIVELIKEVCKVKNGDILVAGMTTPDYIPALKKAAAIVTDEGGITCHAVIVSRELGIPCIIGTKIATKVLQDGDLVEVDAEKGIVKILKKAK